MKALKIGIIVFVVTVVGFNAIGMSLPSAWTVERSTVMHAPPSAIYPWLADLKKWPQWSAFDSEDPNIQYSYSGSDQGVGATRNWISKKMGDGTQTITAADPRKGIEFDLRMVQNGFALKGRVRFEPAEGGTKVTWTDSGDVGMHPLYRIMMSFTDRMMGGTFEESLARLKARAEAK